MTDHAFEERGDYVAPRKRRYGRYAALVMGLLAFGYWLSPYVAAGRLALAAQAGHAESVTERIDINAVRNAFARQIVRTYLARNPQMRDLDGLRRQAVGGVAAGYVSGIIAEYLTPEVIADLLRRGRSASRAGELLGENAPLPRIEGLRQAWALFAASGFVGPASFAVRPAAAGPGTAAPAAAEPGSGYRLIFGLRGTNWLLRAVELPEAALIRLADELSTRIERRS